MRNIIMIIILTFGGLVAPHAVANDAVDGGLVSICRNAVLAGAVPTEAEYDADPNRYEDNFCALLLYEPSRMQGWLGRVIDTNRAWAHPNRHYFNPMFRPGVDANGDPVVFVQLYKRWMRPDDANPDKDVFTVYRQNLTDYTLSTQYGVHRPSNVVPRGYSYTGTVAVAVICSQGYRECYSVAIHRSRPTHWMGERRWIPGINPQGVWSVMIADYGNDANRARYEYLPTAEQVRCYVRGVLVGMETERDDLAGLGDTVAEDCDLPPSPQ